MANKKTVNMRYYIDNIKRIRLLLVALGIIYSYGLHTALNEISSVIFSFVPPTFFALSGYLVLRESEKRGKRILHAVGRTAICFVILAGVYFGISFYADKSTTLSLVSQKTFWVDFLLFNEWSLPVGSTIWYVQSLLYAYIIVYALYKLNLLRFDIAIAGACIVLASLSGEFSSLIGFNLMGHTYISSNFLTRALPYILIGSFIHRKNKFFFHYKIKNYIILSIIGMAMAIGEYVLLSLIGIKSYYTHMLGTVIMTVGVCMLCFFYKWNIKLVKPFRKLNRFECMIPYYVAAPIYYFLIVNENITQSFSDLIGPVTVLCSFLVLYIYTLTRHLLITLKFRIGYSLYKKKVKKEKHSKR